MLTLDKLYTDFSLMISAMVNTVTTTGFIAEILDPSVFDIPPKCQTDNCFNFSSINSNLFFS
jgi:hypothetical protein